MVIILLSPLKAAVLLPLKHPLVEREKIELRSLQAESFILCPEEVKPDVRQQIVRLCKRAGFQPKITQEASPIEVQLRLVKSGMGISLIAANSQMRHNAKVVYRPLVEPIPLLKIAAVWNKNQNLKLCPTLLKNCFCSIAVKSHYNPSEITRSCYRSFIASSYIKPKNNG